MTDDLSSPTVRQKVFSLLSSDLMEVAKQISAYQFCPNDNWRGVHAKSNLWFETKTELPD